MYGYIYETTNLTNGKKYIGQHHSNSFDNSYYGSGHYILDDLKAFGKANFKVKLLEECYNQEDLNKKEKYYIKKLRDNYPLDLIYNIADGGQTGWIYGSRHSEITKERIGLASRNRSKESNKKISKSRKGIEPWNKGKTGVYTPKQIEKMKKSATGRKLSQETKDKISKSSKGRIPWNKGLGKGPYIKKGTQKGFVWITKDNTEITKRISKDDLDNYLVNGWHKGRDIIKGVSSKRKGTKLTEDQRAYISKRTKEVMNSPKVKSRLLNCGKLDNLKGKIGINDGNKRIYINREELSLYLNKGYKLGYPKKKGDG